MDVLADVLAVTRFSNSTLCQASFDVPWGIQFDPNNWATFHIVSRGSCWLIPDNDIEPIHMFQGDVTLMVNGKGHGLADSPETPRKHYLEVEKNPCQSDSFQQNSASLFCGAYHFEQDGTHPLLSLLPAIIYLPAHQAQSDDELQTLIRLLGRERFRASPGSSAVIERLMDVLFVYIVRVWLEQQPECGAGWLGALRDPQLSKVLSLIHEAPQQRWTVDLLAKEIHMSRAAFAKHFTCLVGEAPMTYVRRWRMDLAAGLLRDTSASISSIANQVGYESDTTFSNTFRQSRNISPGHYRSQHKIK